MRDSYNNIATVAILIQLWSAKVHGCVDHAWVYEKVILIILFAEN